MYNVVEVMTVAESVLRDKAKAFAKEIVLLCRQIKANYKESVLTNHPVHPSVQIFTKRSMHREQRILYPNLRLL